MKKSEFLSQLKKALENELDAQSVREHVDYYEEYIRSEMNKGMPEEEVLGQLGDPWAIAKTILLSEKISGQDGPEYSSKQGGSNTAESENYQVSKGAKWKVYAVIAVLLLVALLLFSFIFGMITFVIRLLAQFAVPLLVLALVWKIFANKK